MISNNTQGRNNKLTTATTKLTTTTTTKEPQYHRNQPSCTLQIANFQMQNDDLKFYLKLDNFKWQIVRKQVPSSVNVNPMFD